MMTGGAAGVAGGGHVTWASRRASGTAVAGGAVLVLIAMAGPLTGDGVGSTVSARQFADLVLSGGVASWVPRWAGLIIYVPALAAAVALVGLGLGGRAGRMVTAVAWTLGVVAALALAAALRWQPLAHPGWGAFVALAGLAAMAAGVLARSRRSPGAARS